MFKVHKIMKKVIPKVNILNTAELGNRSFLPNIASLNLCHASCLKKNIPI
jgi:hypothetical protein